MPDHLNNCVAILAATRATRFEAPTFSGIDPLTLPIARAANREETMMFLIGNITTMISPGQWQIEFDKLSTTEPRRLHFEVTR